MRLLILGATGATGQLVVQQALMAENTLIAYVRSAARMRIRNERLTIQEGLLADTVLLTDLLRGCDAVISALGATSGTPQARPAQQLPSVLTAMRQAGVRRYVGISSGAAVNLLGDRKPLPARIVGRLLAVLQPEAVADKRQEYTILRDTPDIDWTLARPPRLIGSRLTAAYVVDLHRPRRLWVSRADVAHFLLRAAREGTWIRQAPFIA